MQEILPICLWIKNLSAMTREKEAQTVDGGPRL